MEKTLGFLKKLKSNNNREWFDRHKEEYLRARDEFMEFCDRVIARTRKFDRRITPEITAANSVFRIYRDIRFSKDKTPYKVHMAASFNPGGRKSVTAGYYLHVQPGGSFAAGGVWMPPPEMLQAIRQEIDYEPAKLLKIMRSAAFRKYFKGFDDEGKMISAPKGYDKNHPQIELLRNRHFIVSQHFSDTSLLSDKAPDQVAACFKAMHPLMEFLRGAQGVE